MQNNKVTSKLLSLLPKVILYILYALTITIPPAVYYISSIAHKDQRVSSHLSTAYLFFTALLSITILFALFTKREHIKYLRAAWVTATLYPLAMVVLHIGGMMSLFGAYLLMSILGFPLSLLGAIVVPLMDFVKISELPEGYFIMSLTVWLAMFIAGYYQWFIFGPRLVDTIIEKSRKRKQGNVKNADGST
jgi:hypothetical protein